MNKITLETKTITDSNIGVVTDKRGFAERWKFSARHVDNLIAKGLPHLKIGKRRVRIIVADADAWMLEQFATRRLGKAQSVTSSCNTGIQ